MRSTMALLRRWFEKIRIAIWLHPEMDGGRRALIFGGAALVAATLIAGVPDLPKLGLGFVSTGNYGELVDITRRAFVPRLFVQIYQASPLLSELLRIA